jgi:glycerophosphoryl diester phosphodiesterase
MMRLLGFVCCLALFKWILYRQLNGFILELILILMIGLMVAVIISGFRSVFHRSLSLSIRQWVSFYLSVVGLLVLLMPFGLFGLTSVIKTAIPISGSLFTWLTINRYPILIGLAGMYLVLLVLALRIRKFLYYLVSNDDNRLATVFKLAWQDGGSSDLWRGGLWLVGMLSASGLIIIGLAGINSVVENKEIWWLSQGVINFVIPLVQLTIILKLLGVPVNYRATDRLWWPIWLLSFAIVGVLGGLSGNSGRQPIPQTVIVHRGVIDHDATGNTIAALVKNSRYHFPYVEMDVQETKDHHFICAHNNTIKIPHGGNQEIDRLSLKTIQQYHRVELFGDYLRVANRLGQPLIIELKLTNHSDSNMGMRFAQLYRHQLQQLPHQVHSIGYRPLRQIKQEIPSIKVGLVTMLNLGNIAKLSVDFYTLEHVTITNYLMRSLAGEGRPIYAWTDNRHDSMIRAAMMGVNGQVTDQADKLATLKMNTDQNRWLLLLNFLLDYL